MFVTCRTHQNLFKHPKIQRNMVLSKKYDPQEAEPRWVEYWEKHKIYKFDPESNKEIFSVDTPPPTISGKLHFGHAFGDTQQDIFCRYKRMKGFNVLQPFGTDNNGLPTLRLIEKDKKVDSRKMSREDFIALCLKTIKEEYIPQFIQDAKRLGLSADWNLFYSTIDDKSRKISQKSFIDLYNQGREYRIEAPALWCTECQTTIAQVELEDKEMFSTFNDIVFKVDGKDLIIATTRPELLPACVAVFYHPGDKRFQKLKDKKAKVPLFDIEVPILPDERADPEKGTGIVMCCTFGDQTDMEWQKAHNLPIKSAINKNGTMTSLAGKYKGLKLEEARKKIIEDLKEANLLIKQEKISHPVNTHERCGTPIEFIHSKQWFIKYLDLKKEMLKWAKQIKWYPEYMKNRYDNWVKGLQWDWCISRQIPFGIPFPVWYCASCDEVILAKEEQLPVDPLVDKPPVEKCPGCGSKNFIPEKDIMNTWATSALTPEIVKGLLEGTKAHKKIKDKPMSIRRNGHDIITFWDFNTVIKSQLHHKRNPWDELYINGWILGKDGKKMSKSRGNSISPQETIAEYSADALRYLCSTAKLGDDIAFPEKELVSGTKTITKLWNASKFGMMHLENYKDQTPKKLEPFDLWLLTKLNKVILDSTESLDKYEYSKAKAETENFFWNTFCDYYLEIIKDRLYNPDKRGQEKKLSAQFTLNKTILSVIKLLAPITPFITEEIYHLGFASKEKLKSIHISEWPKFEPDYVDKALEKKGDYAITVIDKVRKFKAENNVSLKTPIKLTLPNKREKELENFLEDIKAVTKAEEIKFDSKLGISLS